MGVNGTGVYIVNNAMYGVVQRRFRLQGYAGWVKVPEGSSGPETLSRASIRRIPVMFDDRV